MTGVDVASVPKCRLCGEVATHQDEKTGNYACKDHIPVIHRV
jgi:hypothetical protein